MRIAINHKTSDLLCGIIIAAIIRHGDRLPLVEAKILDSIVVSLQGPGHCEIVIEE